MTSDIIGEALAALYQRYIEDHGYTGYTVTATRKDDKNESA